MKYLFLMCLMALLFSCAPVNQTVQFDATLTNMKSEEVKITGFDYEKTITVGESGVVSDTLNIKKEGLYTLRFGRNGMFLYMKPGQNIKLNADAANFSESVVVEGATSDIQNYLKAKDAITKQFSPSRMYKMDESEYEKNVVMFADSLKTLISGTVMPANFKTSEQKNVTYDVARMKMMYPVYSDKKLETLQPFYQDASKGLSFDDESEYLASPEYRKLVKSNFSNKMYGDTTKEYEQLFKENIALLPAGNIKNQLLYGDMRYMMSPNEKLEENYSFFKANSTNTAHLSLMAESYAELEKLKKGSNSPQFDYENYKGGNTSLADLKGKYVYIDVWATWCGPCKAEIPHLKEKEKKYHGKNIEFVSISVDALKDSEKWKAMIKDKELGGTQLFANNSWESDFIQDYKITGIPRFILIDPAGKIVSADAPRPSDDKLEKTFQELDI